MGGRGADSGLYTKAKNIVGQYELGNVRDNASNIKSFYTWVDNNKTIRVEDGSIRMKRAAADELNKRIDKMVDNVTYMDKTYEDEYRNIKSMMRGSYSMSKGDRSSIADFNQYRKRGNHVKISNKSSRSVDSLYQELSKSYPHHFSSSVTHPADQLKTINDTLNYLKPKRKKLDSYTKNQIKKGLFDDVIQDYGRRLLS